MNIKNWKTLIYRPMPEPEKKKQVIGIKFVQTSPDGNLTHTTSPVSRWHLKDGHLMFYDGDILRGEAVNVIAVGVHTFEDDDE